MQHDDEFTLTQATVPIPSLTSKFSVTPFGDVHRFAGGCDVERWRQFCRDGAKAVRSDPGAYFVGMGDLDDMLSRSERKAWQQGAFHEATREILDNGVKERWESYMVELDWLKGRCLGLIGGNHYWQYEDGTTTTDHLAQRLQCPVLGGLAYVVVHLEIGSSSTMSYNIELCLHHGRAGGKLLGTSINQIDDMRNVFPMADAYYMGHNHQRGVWPTSRLTVKTVSGVLQLKQKRQLLVRTGSFLRAYVPGKRSYLIQKIARPADLGAVKTWWTFSRPRVGGAQVMLAEAHGSS